MPAKTDLTTLADVAAQAEERYLEAQAAADAARAQAEQRREAALRGYDRARLDGYDDTQLEADVRAAADAVRDAISTTPLFKALVDYQAARIRRAGRHAEATGDAARLALSEEERRRRISPPTYPSAPSLEEVLQMVERIAASTVADEEEARFAAREAAGDAAAAGG